MCNFHGLKDIVHLYLSHDLTEIDPLGGQVSITSAFTGKGLPGRLVNHAGGSVHLPRTYYRRAPGYYRDDNSGNPG